MRIGEGGAKRSKGQSVSVKESLIDWGMVDWVEEEFKPEGSM